MSCSTGCACGVKDHASPPAAALFKAAVQRRTCRCHRMRPEAPVQAGQSQTHTSGVHPCSPHMECLTRRPVRACSYAPHRVLDHARAARGNILRRVSNGTCACPQGGRL